MKFIGAFLMVLLFIDITSCGKLSEAADAEESIDNDCGLRYVSGQRCIVCEKGGVSCDWD